MLTDCLLFLIPLLLSAQVSLPIFWFAPLLVYFFYKKPLSEALVWTFVAGICLDLIHPALRFGITPLFMLITTLVLYEQKRHFFFDSLTTFPLMTLLYSLIFTLLLALWVQPPLTLSWAISDLVLMPLLDASAAFISITLPLMLLGPIRRKGEDYFL